MKTPVYIFFLMTVLIIASGCSSPRKLSVKPDHVDMLVSLDGEEDDYYEELILWCDGEIIDSRKARWKSDNVDAATVDNSGWVTSKGTGTAVITARYKGVSAQSTINVTRKITSDSRR